jgi:hypothetical protein
MSINNNTMLVGISFGLPRQTRQLKTETSIIEQKHHAQAGVVSNPSGYYFRKIEGKSTVDGLKALKEFQTSWKASLEHFARYPFASGMKLLPAALVAQFVEVNESFQRRQAGVWLDWIEDEYPQWAGTAEQRMGSLYDASDFPSAADCERRFVCEITVVPLPEVEQWKRIEVISPDLASTMQATQNAAVDRVRRESHAMLWNDVLTPLTHMIELLGRDKTRISENLINNIIKVVDLVPAYNQMHQDEHLTQIAERIKTGLSSISIDDLRKSPEAKAEAVNIAKEIVAEFQPYARKFAEEDDE